MAVPPRPASTVVLLRPSARGSRVWLMRRHRAMAFAAGMHAFPGGSVEVGDGDPSIGWIGPPPEALAARLGTDASTARALLVAGVRETFEECGVLLASSPADAEPIRADGAAWERARLDLIAGTVSFADLLAAHGLQVRADLLVPLSRWITPDWSPRRFDAYFFLCALSEGPEPRFTPGEADWADWVDVADAVDGYARDTVPMMPPTIATLREVAAHPDPAAVLEAAPQVIAEESG